MSDNTIDMMDIVRANSIEAKTNRNISFKKEETDSSAGFELE